MPEVCVAVGGGVLSEDVGTYVTSVRKALRSWCSVARQYVRGGLDEEYKQARRAIEDLERLAKHAEAQTRQVRALQDELEALQELDQDGEDGADAPSLVCPNCGERVRGFVDCYAFTCPFCGRAYTKVDIVQMKLAV